MDKIILSRGDEVAVLALYEIRHYHKGGELRSTEFFLGDWQECKTVLKGGEKLLIKKHCFELGDEASQFGRIDAENIYMKLEES